MGIFAFVHRRRGVPEGVAPSPAPGPPGGCCRCGVQRLRSVVPAEAQREIISGRLLLHLRPMGHTLPFLLQRSVFLFPASGGGGQKTPLGGAVSSIPAGWGNPSPLLEVIVKEVCVHRRTVCRNGRPSLKVVRHSQGREEEKRVRLTLRPTSDSSRQPLS